MSSTQSYAQRRKKQKTISYLGLGLWLLSIVALLGLLLDKRRQQLQDSPVYSGRSSSGQSPKYEKSSSYSPLPKEEEQEELSFPQEPESDYASEENPLYADMLTEEELQAQENPLPTSSNALLNIYDKRAILAHIDRFFELEEQQDPYYVELYAPLVERYYINGKNWSRDKLRSYRLKRWRERDLIRRQKAEPGSFSFEYLDNGGLRLEFLFHYKEVTSQGEKDWESYRGEMKLDAQGYIYYWRAFNL